jgi:hypothetical protein
MIIANINPIFKSLDIDYLYHLGLDTSMQLENIFKNVSTIIFTEDNNDALIIANQLSSLLFNISELYYDLKPLFKTERYHFYLIKQFIIVSTGIGSPSALICLNEISKLLFHAKVRDPYYIQITPSFNINNKANHVELIHKVFNTNHITKYENISCGKYYCYQSIINKNNIDNFINANKNYKINISNSITVPDLMSFSYTNDFNQQFIDDNNVFSANMDNNVFAGFCNHMQINSLIFNYITNMNHNNPIINTKNSLHYLTNLILGFRSL